MPFFKSDNKAKSHKAKAPAAPFDPYYGFSDGFSGSHQSRRGSDSSGYQYQSPAEGGQYICACKACIDAAMTGITKRGEEKVICIHKANIMKLADGLFRGTFNRLAKNFPQLERRRSGRTIEFTYRSRC
ncbi:hypothetical protein B0H65DRAFT_544741 [Neurospora tetraspora]|uniref:Uncharacterized protein n=1 Tax=Neurospora tetraspora TaxID=94610 RepID=A0AAE0MWJ1_9PEZI|nr:hypothetical protein B0H65DRAFT_544741 [Neurospora tetraspora]